jgi:hypothetical protein
VTESFQIHGWVEGVEGVGDGRTVRINVSLQDGNRGKDAPELLRTGLTMPIGQSVILGSARPMISFGTRAALILVVQPEVVDSPRR